jgi:hypothetical protein
MDTKGMRQLQRKQDGVITRAQLLGLGAKQPDLDRMLRRRELTRVHAGIYVDHTGELTWRQRAWAAVLAYAPAALAGRSALQAEGVRGHDSAKSAPIVVCVDRRRSVRRRAGIHVTFVSGFEERCQVHKSPPRLRVDHALVYEAAARDRPDAALAVLADAVQQGVTTPARLASTLEAHPTLRHRRLLMEILQDVAAGAYSVLEHHYLVDVERPHGLPAGDRQRRVKPGKTVAYRDVDYLELGTGVELDGRLGHEEALDRWGDLARDLDAAATGQVTLRAGWGQVLEPCRLAGIIGGVLTSRGWAGELRPCGPGCRATDRPTNHAPAA